MYNDCCSAIPAALSCGKHCATETETLASAVKCTKLQFLRDRGCCNDDSRWVDFWLNLEPWCRQPPPARLLNPGSHNHIPSKVYEPANNAPVQTTLSPQGCSCRLEQPPRMFPAWDQLFIFWKKWRLFQRWIYNWITMSFVVVSEMISEKLESLWSLDPTRMLWYVKWCTSQEWFSCKRTVLLFFYWLELWCTASSAVITATWYDLCADCHFSHIDLHGGQALHEKKHHFLAT